MTKNWIAVASADHAARGREGNFMQVCHGKGGPLKRLAPGDVVAYYSPTRVFGEPDPYRCFTSLGRVKAADPYRHDMGGFVPFRRDVAWFDANETSILPLLDLLDFTRGRISWGYRLRLGLFEISAHDMAIIAAAMGVEDLQAVQLDTIENSDLTSLPAESIALGSRFKSSVHGAKGPAG